MGVFRLLYGLVLVSVMVSAMAAGVITEQRLAGGAKASAPRALWTGQQALLAFYDQQGTLSVWNPLILDSRIQTISPRTGPQMVNSWIDFSQESEHLYMLWRPKIAQGERRGDKIILFSASDDDGASFSAPVQLNSQGGAFHPNPLTQGGNGLLYLVWPDERSRPEGIYFNRSSDHGKTWLKPELRMDRLDQLGNEATMAKVDRNRLKPAAVAYDPFMAAEQSKIWLGWSEIGAKRPYDQNVLKFRASQDAGTTWSEETKLPTPGQRTFNSTLLRTGDSRLSLFYFVASGGIFIVHSEDNGKTWSEPQPLGGTTEVGGQRFKAVQNRQGTVCLTWEGPNRLQDGEKADVFVTCSQDHGRTWPAEPTRLDTNAPRLSHSLAPRMALDNAGNIVVAWQDSRHVRPNIYLSYSRDAGRHWAEQDVRLDPEPGRYQSTYPWVESAGAGRFLVTWQTKTKDGPDNVYKLSYAAFTLPGIPAEDNRFPVLEPALEQPLSANEAQQRRQRLVQRVREYWQAMVDADYAKAYSLMDPFYRAGANLMMFGSPLSKFQYHDYRLPENGIAIAGNMATFQVKITREAPLLILKGIRTAIPKQEIQLPEKWVWVDGDWYRVYENEGANFLPL